MRPAVGEYYYFDKKAAAAGAIKRTDGSEFILRGMEFKHGECIGQDDFTYHFKGMMGNTTYYFKIGKYGINKPHFLTKPPSEK
jgi:hypothetical protein